MDAGAILQIALFGVAVVLVALALAIALRRLHRDFTDARRRKHEAHLRPLMMRLLSDDDADLSTLDGVRGSEARALEMLAWSMLPKVRGGSRGALVDWLEKRGAIDAAQQRTRRIGAVGRARSAERLGAAGLRRAAPDVIDLLSDNDAEVRIVAARALGKLGDPQAVPALLAALDGKRAIPAGFITMALLHIGPEIGAELTDALTSESVAARSAAADLLGRNGVISATNRLSAVVQSDPEIDVRIRAASSLGRIGSPKPVDILIRATHKDSPVALRIAAAMALGQIGGHGAVTTLHDIVNDPDAEVGRAAAEALTKAGPEGLTILDFIAADNTAVGQARAAHWAVRSRVVQPQRRARRRTPQRVDGVT